MERLVLRLHLGAMLLFALLFVTPANADPSCVSYSVTAPVVGTLQDTRCVPLPGPFNVPFSVSNCRGVPPLGTTVCIGVDLNLWLP
ncbi:MAG: hypothetical protein WEB06_13915 [Actinomycetota bacterium]